MNKLTRLLALSWFLLVVSGCSNFVNLPQETKPVADMPDQEASRLAGLSEQAKQLAQNETPDPVLHQIDTDLKSITFRFTDSESTKEISVFIPAIGIPPEQWKVDVNDKTPLVGNKTPGLNLGALKIGPGRVAQEVIAHWRGCTIRSITLYYEKDLLTWVAFCNTPKGVVTGLVNAETGVFTPSVAPPASLPLTATPVP